MMNEEINIEKTDLKVVKIDTGSVISPSHVDKYTLFGAECRTFYMGRLTRDFNRLDEVRWDKDGNPRGDVAVFDAEREEKASALRKSIQEIKDALEREKLRLHEVYAGPRPVTCDACGKLTPDNDSGICTHCS
jgi:uncharacterized protein (UPF0212 family)